MFADLGRVCLEDHRILLILLDMGVAHQLNMERGGGCSPHQKHPSAFFPILSLSLFVCLFLFSFFVSSLVSIIPLSVPHSLDKSHTHNGLSLIQHDIYKISATIFNQAILIGMMTYTDTQSSLDITPSFKNLLSGLTHVVKK